MDALYENQEKWYQNGSLDDVVFTALGGDEYFRLRRLLPNPSIDSAIESEVALGRKKEVTSTPTMFAFAIGREQKIVGTLPYPILKSFFDGIVKGE
jgi:hypothetical protein